MSTDADLFTDEPAPQADLFTDEPAPKPRSVGGFVQNAIGDVSQMAKGIGNFAVGMVTHPQDTISNTMQNLPPAIVNEAKRIGLVGEGGLISREGIHPVNAIKKFGGAMYDKPATTALDVWPAANAASKTIKAIPKVLGIGSAKELATLGDKAARAAAGATDDLVQGPVGAPPPINLPEEAGQILKKAPEAPVSAPESAAAPQAGVPLGQNFQETVQNLGKKVSGVAKGPMDEMKNFLEQKFGKLAAKPSWPQELGSVMERKAQGMKLKEIGFSPGQLRKLYEKFGEDRVLALADFADQKGITKEFLNYKMGQKINELSKSSGRMIGGIRDMATKRGAVHNPQEVVDAIRSQLDSKYLTGVGSTQKGAYMKALQDINRGATTPSELAETVTNLNHYATKNKMVQSTGAYTDVANAASRINNELIKKMMSPAEWNAYQEALKEFGAAEVFKRGYGFTFGREMAGRTGPGNPWNFVKDVGGRKIMEGMFDKVGKKLKSNPEIARSPALLTRELLDDISTTLDEIIDQVGSGGINP